MLVYIFLLILKIIIIVSVVSIQVISNFMTPEACFRSVQSTFKDVKTFSHQVIILKHLNNEWNVLKTFRLSLKAFNLFHRPNITVGSISFGEFLFLFLAIVSVFLQQQICHSNEPASDSTAPSGRRRRRQRQKVDPARRIRNGFLLRFVFIRTN